MVFQQLKNTLLKRLRLQGKSMYILSTNDKTIKLWKVTEKNIKKAMKQGNSNKLELPKMQVIQNNAIIPTLAKQFPSLHRYHINSISISSNEEFMISSDDLRVYLWSLQAANQEAFSVIDLKPENLEDLAEVITASQFHPLADNQFIFSTSKGVIKLADLRKNGCCDQTASIYAEKEDPNSKNFFTEIVQSISDVSWSCNGRYIFARDFLTVKIWDVNMLTKPVSTVQIFEPLKTKLCELYENECIFDKFNVGNSFDSNFVVTGNFNNTFHLIDRLGETNLQFELNFNKKTMVKQIPKKYFENLGTKYDFSKKVLKCTFNPVRNQMAVACQNCLYFYEVQ